MYDKQKEAARRYRAASHGKLKQINVKFWPGEMDLFEHADKQGGRGSYIKRLIREDMERSKEEDSE